MQFLNQSFHHISVLWIQVDCLSEVLERFVYLAHASVYFANQDMYRRFLGCLLKQFMQYLKSFVKFVQS